MAKIWNIEIGDIMLIKDDLSWKSYWDDSNEGFSCEMCEAKDVKRSKDLTVLERPTDKLTLIFENDVNQHD